ncbi:UPF0669 protein v1g209471-like [Ptiloglossa arizonensis]|uniref:UPF0669 protein v1g209471-like n=1 Tax=Ptiloglossa arizonensis TaxID=3350558 RepID=UPI003FA095F2
MKNIFIFIVLQLPYVLALRERLLHYITDELVGGSYKYYSLTYDGFIKVILISETGDADLYASQTLTKPTYQLDEYCLQSATCGEDIILIPDSFKRPVSIGVYGHPSYEISKYILLVYETTDTEHILYGKNLNSIRKNYNNEEQGTSISASITWYLLDLVFQILF